MTEAVEISGIVFSDQGVGASFMALDWVQKALRERLGFTAYPATLNLRPDSAESLARWDEIRRLGEAVLIAPPDSSFCHSLCFPVEVAVTSAGEGEQIRGAVLLPQVDGYPSDKMEIVAPVNIKHTLAVRDGDSLRVKFF